MKIGSKARIVPGVKSTWLVLPCCRCGGTGRDLYDDGADCTYCGGQGERHSSLGKLSRPQIDYASFALSQFRWFQTSTGAVRQFFSIQEES